MYIHNIPKYMAFYFACQMALSHFGVLKWDLDKDKMGLKLF